MQTDAHAGQTALPGPLKWSVETSPRTVLTRFTAMTHAFILYSPEVATHLRRVTEGKHATFNDYELKSLEHKTYPM